MSSIEKVFIAGAGLMGSGIAHAVITNAKKEAVLYDISDEVLQKSIAGIKKVFSKMQSKNLISDSEVEEALSKLSISTNLEDAKSCQLVIEAIVEKIDIKREFFKKLDSICSSETIFASNTSSLPITLIATSTNRSDKFIGMHFFSPVHRMKLIEIIKGTDTSPETFEIAKSFSELLGKSVSTSEDYPGFITTRLGMVLMNEAAFCLFEGVGTAEDIDKGMKLGYNHPIGPLALADAIGLDTCLSILDIMYNEYKDSKYRACPLFRKLINAGHYGKKTGKGFYTYQ